MDVSAAVGRSRSSGGVRDKCLCWNRVIYEYVMDYKISILTCLVLVKNVNLAVVSLEEPIVVTEENDVNPQYSYGYQIEDILTGDIKSQEERRDGDVVTGSYSVVEPDGSRRIVDYTADSVNGFNAVLRREPFKLPASSLVQNPISETDPEARIKGLAISDLRSQIPSRPSTVHFITPYSNYRTLIPPFADYVPVASVSPQAAQIIGSVAGNTGPSIPIAVSGDALTKFALAASKSNKSGLPVAFAFAKLAAIPFNVQGSVETSGSDGGELATEKDILIDEQIIV